MHAWVNECNKLMCAVLAVAALVVFALSFRMSPRVELAFGYWPDPVRATLAAVSAIVFLAALAKLAAAYLDWLAAIGRATLPILVLHVGFYSALKPVFAGLSGWLAVPLAMLVGVGLPWLIDWLLLSRNRFVSWVFYPRNLIDRWFLPQSV